MPHKPSKWGFKIHCLVDSKTDYLYDAIIDPGKNNKNFMIIQQYPIKKKNIFFISNFYESIEKIKEYYVKENWGVDKLNQNTSYFNFERKVMKWWEKFFFWGLEVAINNAYIISILIDPLLKKK